MYLGSRKTAVLLVFLLFCSKIAQGQGNQIGNGREVFPEELPLEQLMELLSEEQLEQIGFTDYSERLIFRHNHPFNLNTVTAEELRTLVFLSPLVIRHILEYRNRAGRFISPYELQVIEGVDSQTARLLAYFVIVGEMSTLENASYRELATGGDHEVFLRYGRIIERQAGYAVQDPDRSRYLGSPDRLLLRYRYNYSSDVRIALNMEKDAGEAFFGSEGQRYGFDFYSGSIQLKGLGNFSSIVLGDYQLRFGQGVGLWQGFSPGKGAMLHGIAKQGTGLRPHTSVDEINFFRGIAVTLPLGSLRATPFISHRWRDANVQTDAAGKRSFSSLGQSGLHRTPSEVANRFQVGQWTYGLNLEIKKLHWQVGTTWYRSALGAEWTPQPLLRNKFAFRGSGLVHTSLYYQFNYRNGYFFGEAAQSYPGGLAFVNGALISLHHHLSLGLLHRYYQKDHYTFYGQAYGEGSLVSNEQGIYGGLLYQPGWKVSWVVYYDLFRFPWLRYRVDAPSQGMDLMSDFTYSWSRQTKFSARIRYRESQGNRMDNSHLPMIGLIRRKQFRFAFDSRIGAGWRIRNRLEGTAYMFSRDSEDKGWMFYQDVFYQPSGARLTGNIRLALFATPGYDTRIYAFENDVLHAGSFPVYYGHGFRAYLNIRWRISRRVDIWMRYAIFRYHDRVEIGSGLERIGGPLKSELKTQLRIRIR